MICEPAAPPRRRAGVLLLALTTALGLLLGAQAVMAPAATAAPPSPSPAPSTSTSAPGASASSPAPSSSTSPSRAPSPRAVVQPQAVPDEAITTFQTPAYLAGVTNDLEGDPPAPLLPALATFAAENLAQAPPGSSISTDHRTMTFKGQGTWLFAPNGSVLFRPATGYAGHPPAVGYFITDAANRGASATLSVTVRPGPKGVPDTGTTPQNRAITVNVVANDVPGQSVDTNQGSIYGWLSFPRDGQPAGSTVRDSDVPDTVLDVPDEGQYTVAPDDRSVTFRPEPGFFGTASPIRYNASDDVIDAKGRHVHNRYTSTLTVTVRRTLPVAVDDTARTAYGEPVQVTVLRNDSPGDPGAPLKPSSLRLRLVPGLPPDATLVAGATVLRIPGAGDFSAGPDGVITYFPADDFLGAVPVVGYSVSDTNGTTALGRLSVQVASPLSVTAAANAASITRTGQTVVDTFTVRNGSEVSLTGLVVAAAGAGLSPVVCAPVSEGGTLAAGATTTCHASRSTVLDDLRQRAVTDTATATAQTPGGQSVSGQALVTLPVKVAGPKAPFQHLVAFGNGPRVVFPAARLAGPSVPGGPPIDVSRTVLSDTPYNHGKFDSTNVGRWYVQPDGSIELDPVSSSPPTMSGSVHYRVFDALGHSATGVLGVSERLAPVWHDTRVSTPQGQRLRFDALADDEPGQAADGTRATFDRKAVRFTTRLGVGEVAPDGRTYTVPWQGTFTVGADGWITFVPSQQFSGSAEFDYTVSNSAGQPITGYGFVTVEPVSPHPKAERRAVTAGRSVVFAAASNDLPGDPAVPVRPAATVLATQLPSYDDAPQPDGRETTVLVDGAGTWRVRADGSVSFTPVNGYAGTDEVLYAAVDRNGTRSWAGLTVTIRPGPLVRPDARATAQGTPVRLDPLANDVPGQTADGTTGAFERSSLRFAVYEQPPGSTTSTDRKKLTVPMQGAWSIVDGQVTFTPSATFAGGAAPVTYQVADAAGFIKTGLVTVTVRSTAPAANDDVTTTPYETGVTLPAATNDVAGAEPLDPAATRFPVDGQPAGSTRTADGRSLTVPGQGTFVLAADGSATFTPAPKFVGATTPVAYTISDRRGTTARATLKVSVRPGPQGRPDTAIVVDQPRSSTTLAVVANDLPGRNADGTLGHLDRTTLRLAATGQPPGWTVGADGLSATNPNGFQAGVNPFDGTVDVGGFGGLTGPLAYTVDEMVTTAGGRTVRHVLTGTVQVNFPAVNPRGVLDHVFSVAPSGVELYPTQNDIPVGPVAIPINGQSLTFPADQLPGLPRGSTIVAIGNGNQSLRVPNEGVWNTNVYEGKVYFRPAEDFVGDTSTVRYAFRDDAGHPGSGPMLATVRPGWSARPDTARTPVGVPVTVDLRANDDPGQNVDGTPANRDRGVQVLDDDGIPAGGDEEFGLRRTVAGEGTYTVDLVSGLVTFTPVRGFVGPATPVRFAVADTTTSALQVTVVPVSPVARADAATTGVGRPVPVAVLANDTAGAAPVPLVPGSVRLVAGASTGQTSSLDGKRLDIAGRGVFLVAGDGEITFVPLGSATGPVAVGYSVADLNGTTAGSSLAVTVG